MESLVKSVFISRDISAQSVFWQMLTRAGVEVSGQSLVNFQAVSFREVPDADWIFFYSPRAVRFFFQQIEKRPFKSARLAAVGPATAREVGAEGFVCDFVGTGEPETTARAFHKVAAGCKVLFPQARHSRQSIQKKLGSAIEPRVLVVYDNQSASDVPAVQAEVLVFTSPLNAQTYLNQHLVQPSQRVVAIGQPTAAACRAAGVNPVIAAAPDESSLAKAVLNCLEA